MSWEIKALQQLVPDALSGLIYPIYKSHLAPVRLLHFFALALLVSRLTTPDWRGLTKFWMTAMIRCGENSLFVYCLSVLLSFVGFIILRKFLGAFIMQVFVSIAGIALMVAVATIVTWTSKQDRPGPKLF